MNKLEAIKSLNEMKQEQRVSGMKIVDILLYLIENLSEQNENENEKNINSEILEKIVNINEFVSLNNFFCHPSSLYDILKYMDVNGDKLTFIKKEKGKKYFCFKNLYYNLDEFLKKNKHTYTRLRNNWNKFKIPIPDSTTQGQQIPLL